MGLSLKSIGKFVGKGLKLISPLGGPLIGAGASALGSVLEGGNMGDHLKSAAIGGVGGGVASKLGAVKAIPGLTGASIRPLSTPPIAGSGETAGMRGMGFTDMLGGLFSGAGSALGRGVDWVRDNPDLALSGAAGLYGAKKMNDAGKLREKGLSAATAAYDERKPLRAKAIRNLTDPIVPNLDPMFYDPTNPFSRVRGI